MLFVQYPEPTGNYSLSGDLSFVVHLLSPEDYEGYDQAGYRVRRPEPDKVEIHIAHCIFANVGAGILDGTWLPEWPHKKLDDAIASGEQQTSQQSVLAECCFKDQPVESVERGGVPLFSASPRCTASG